MEKLYSFKDIVNFFEEEKNRKEVFLYSEPDDGMPIIVGYNNTVGSNYDYYSMEIWSTICQAITLYDYPFKDIYKKEWQLLREEEKTIILNQLKNSEDVRS